MKKKQRPIEQILEDILKQLEIKNSQPILPPYQIITPNQAQLYNPNTHYHGSGIPCTNNPCYWA
jgi:hypothetical protein